MNYYKKELATLIETQYFITVKLKDGKGNATKTMDLNTTSIPVLIDWLKAERSRLIALGKDGEE